MTDRSGLCRLHCLSLSTQALERSVRSSSFFGGIIDMECERREGSLTGSRVESESKGKRLVRGASVIICLYARIYLTNTNNDNDTWSRGKNNTGIGDKAKNRVLYRY